MGVKERRERQKETLRREILEAATDLFVHEGFANVSMRKIAERIEYSPTTIYLYFKNKADLLATICDETFAQLIEIHEGISHGAGDPLSRLRRGLRAYVDFGLAHPNQYVLTFMSPFDRSLLSSEVPYEASVGARSFGVLRRVVSECVERRVFRDVDVEVASQALWAAVHGVTSLLIAHPDFPWADRDSVVDAVIDAATEGFVRSAR